MYICLAEREKWQIDSILKESPIRSQVDRSKMLFSIIKATIRIPRVVRNNVFLDLGKNVLSGFRCISYITGLLKLASEAIGGIKITASEQIIRTFTPSRGKRGA